jgi:hypothetical protein
MVRLKPDPTDLLVRLKPDPTEDACRMQATSEGCKSFTSLYPASFTGGVRL